MHLYYYEAKDYIYVYDQNHKLYQYPNNENSRKLLILENTLKLLKEELNIPYHKCNFKYFEEFDAKENYAFLEIAKMVSLLEYSYLPSIGYLLIIIEGIILNIVNEDYKTHKNKKNAINDYSDSVLVRYIQALDNKIKDISKDISIKEVPLSFIDSSLNKVNLDNIYFNYKINEMAFEIQANFFTNEVFSGNIYNINSDNIDDIEMEKILQYKTLMNEYKEKYQKEIQEKKDYNSFLYTRELFFHFTQLALTFPCFLGMVNELIDSDLLRTCSRFMLIPFILGELIGKAGLNYTNEILENMDNPTLSLHKEEKL